MTPEIFLDTAYAIALSSPKGLYHEKAVQLAVQLKKENNSLITTRAVLLEIGNAFAKLRYRNASIQLLDAIETDPTIGIVPLIEPLYTQALELYRNRMDKEWGLVDCLSFIVMQERQIAKALTTDLHFEQAGFQVLLRD